MNSTVTAVNDIPALDHEAAMAVAEAEYACLLETVESLEPRDWACPSGYGPASSTSTGS